MKTAVLICILLTTVAITMVGCNCSDETEFQITRISSPQIVTCDGPMKDVSVYWEGDCSFPVTVSWEIGPDGCPQGGCAEPEYLFEKEANPLVMEKAAYCHDYYEDCSFGYDIVITDSQGNETPPMRMGFNCDVQEREEPEIMPTESPAPTETPAEPIEAGQSVITLSSTNENDVLFYISNEQDARVYYQGTTADGSMDLTHVTLEDDTGNCQVVIFHEFIPIQWILNDYVIAVYHTDKEKPLDPHDAYHAVISREREELEITTDIYPNDLQALLNRMESATGERYDEARDFLAEHAIDDFAELVALAQTGGADQPRFIAAAVGFGTIASALSLDAEMDAIEALAQTTAAEGYILASNNISQFHAEKEVIASSLTGALVKGVGGNLVKYAGGQLEEYLLGELSPQGPDMLLCRGGSAIPQVCHYVFFPLECHIGCTDSFGCVDFCMPTMDCFSNICTRKSGGMTSELAGDLINNLMQ